MRTMRRLLVRLVSLLSLALLLTPDAAPALAADPAASPAADSPLVVKVMIITMFKDEAAPWLRALAPLQDFPVVGLSSDYPDVHCTATAVCLMTTGMGHANAAASVLAVVLSNRFDLRRTYFIVTGIAGIDPSHGTLGSAAWARYVVDSGIAHEIDAREMPKGWPGGYFGILTDRPGQKPSFDYRTELFQLNEALLKRALALSAGVHLEDSADVRSYRRHYPQAAAHDPPRVIQCDTASGDTWWTGSLLGEQVSRWTRLLTDGAGDYCTTQQEDNATLNALTRGSQSGRVDLKRVAVLRTGSDFDRPYPGETALQGLLRQRSLEGALRISTDNLVLAAKPLVDAIVAHWGAWSAGVP